MGKDGRIIIIGAGPTGLGAAYRLSELGFEDFNLYEANEYVGGLAASFTDVKGFTWDIGGHVLFSHYEYFDTLMKKLIRSKGWLTHERESWIWVKGRFVPYPFQNNIRHLPRKELLECVSSLIDARVNTAIKKPSSFEDWILANFGDDIARHFLMPYNNKVWAYPPSVMDYGWIGERVSAPDLKRVILNILEKKDDVSWGPNNKFKFPLRGGTGSIWERLADRIPEDKIALKKEAIKVDLDKRVVFFSDGETAHYDTLISTAPLDTMSKMCPGMDAGIRRNLAKLKFSSVYVVGVGINGTIPDKLKTKCWMYFPEDNCPFYRVTVFSNYSPKNVPDSINNWSLMAEVSESRGCPTDGAKVVSEVIKGLKNTRLIKKDTCIESVWAYRSEYGNPTPFLGRDEVVDSALKYLESKGVYSRGRFGAWKYEVSNMDHSVMQGVELVDRLLKGAGEFTLPSASKVNRNMTSHEN